MAAVAAAAASHSRHVYFCSLLFSAPYLSSRNCELLAQAAFRVQKGYFWPLWWKKTKLFWLSKLDLKLKVAKDKYLCNT